LAKESRYDRQLRLHKVEHLLYGCGEAGMAVAKLAASCGVSLRTTQRDLAAIEEAGIFPTWRDNGKCGLVMERYLPPIRFSSSEALNLFMASWLMLSYAQRYDPDIASIFTKLNCVLPAPIREQVRKTIEWMETLPKNDRVVKTLKILADAWINGCVTRISYWPLTEEKSSTRDLEVYYIQPMSPGHAAYVIGYCRHMKDVRTFKVERIEKIEVLQEKYTIPADFDANKFLSGAWGIVVTEDVIRVRLKITKPVIVRIMQETVWHPSQRVEELPDGTAIMTLDVNYTTELVSWILGWGSQVEVLEPEELRGGRSKKRSVGWKKCTSERQRR
jgi:predicted DNA-binding transcriptional regulator YafY